MVSATDGEADVVTNLRRVLGVPVRGDHEDAVRFESRVHDAVARAGRHRLAAVVRCVQLELSAENPVVMLHGFAGAALEVDVRGEMRLAHVISSDSEPAGVRLLSGLPLLSMLAAAG